MTRSLLFILFVSRAQHPSGCAAQPDSLSLSFSIASKTNCTLLYITGRPIVQTNYKLRSPLRNKRSHSSISVYYGFFFLSKNCKERRNESEKLHGQSSTCFFDTFGTLRQSSFTGCQLPGKNSVRHFFRNSEIKLKIFFVLDLSNLRILYFCNLY